MDQKPGDDGDKQQRRNPGRNDPTGLETRGCAEGRRRRIDDAHVRDEPEAAPVLGAQHRLVLAVVPHRLAGPVHGLGERRRAHGHPRPQGVEQLVRGDDALAVLDQIGEDIEHLRLDRNPASTLLEDSRFSVELILAKRELHRREHSVSPKE